MSSKFLYTALITLLGTATGGLLLASKLFLLIMKEIMNDAQQYELMYLLSPRVSDVEQASVAEHIKKIIENAGGKIADEVMWGKQRLAYPIDKNEMGTYVVLKLMLEPQSVRTIDQQLRLIEQVLRHLVIRKDSQKIRKIEEEKAATKTTAAAPEVAVAPSLGEPSLVKKAAPMASGSTEAPAPAAKAAIGTLDLESDKELDKAGVAPDKDAGSRHEHTHTQTEDEIKQIDEKLDDILDNDITK